MRIEDFKFEIGDMLRLDTRYTVIVDDFMIEDISSWGFEGICNFEDIEKVDRYIEHHKEYSSIELPKPFYTLETVWERKEEIPKGIQELELDEDFITSVEKRTKDKINELVKAVNSLLEKEE